MLSKKNKLKREGFRKLGAQRIIYHAPHITLCVFKKEGSQNPSLFSFVVSKKSVSKSVDRNKLKRRGFSVIQKVINKVKPNFSLVFYTKKTIPEISFKELEKEILFLLKKANTLI